MNFPCFGNVLVPRLMQNLSAEAISPNGLSLRFEEPRKESPDCLVLVIVI